MGKRAYTKGVPFLNNSGIPLNSENEPRGLYFLKALFEGLVFWRGSYSERLMYGGKFAFQNRLG